MKKLYYVLLLVSIAGYSQSPAGIWYFGKKAGISFNSGNNPVSLSDGQIDTNEGCATLCDTSGNLLFYTDGIKIWNRNHVVMPNGTGLHGDPSSTQSAIIVPKPNSATIFYIFTVDELGKPNGLKYSIIDLSLDGGFGDITSKNVLLTAPALEKITVAQHSNGINYWVVAHKYGNNQYVSYEVTSAGITTVPVISAVGTSISNDTQRTLGYMKSSPNGNFIATAHAGNGSNVQLFNFNNTTGQLTLFANLPINSNSLGAYGLEFSSNSNLLYVTKIDYPSSTSEILQFDIQSQNEATILLSKVIVGSFVFDEFFEGVITALQLAPNQKIYVGQNISGFLGVINNPNVNGIGCQYVPNAVDLGGNTCYYGLPSFITSFLDLNFTSNNYCNGSATQFAIPAINDIQSVVWNFGDVLSLDNASVDDEPTHVYTTTGTYTVTLTIQTSTITKVFTRQIQIIASPVAFQPTDYSLCEVTTDEAIFTLSSKDNEVLGTQSASNYTIKYFLNLDDAQNNVNQLTDSYTNISNPQTIFARIQPSTGGECYDLTSFELIVSSKPKLSANDQIYYCLNSFPQTKVISAGNLNPSDILGYVWSSGQTTESIQINQAGNYTVTATNIFGCASSRTITVINSEIASVTYNILGNIGNNSLQIIPVGSGNYVYALDNEFGNYQTSPIFNSVSSGNHIFYVKDINDCGIVSEQFSVLGYPKYFTPNDDGQNDSWNLQGVFLDVKQTYIYDRYGKFIYEIKPNSAGWDGNYNGQKMTATDYWFVTTLNNGKEIKGHFALKR